jgi:thioredoxin 1
MPMLLQTPFLTLTDNNFQAEVDQAQVPVLVDCWATWCMPQYSINPIFDNLALEFAEQILIGRLNIAVSEQIAAKYDIRAVPTLLIFSHGKVVCRRIGVASQHEISQQLNILLLDARLNRSGMSRSLISCS